MLSSRSEDAGGGTVEMASLQDKHTGSWFPGRRPANTRRELY